MEPTTITDMHYGACAYRGEARDYTGEPLEPEAMRKESRGAAATRGPPAVAEADGVMTEGDWRGIDATARDASEPDETETSTAAGGRWRPMGASS